MANWPFTDATGTVRQRKSRTDGGAEVVSVDIAQSGTEITGATIPTGGVGVIGWLSAIWSKLSGTLTVSGTVTANTGLTQPLTDTQLRATAIPVSVSGVATAANQTTANSSLATIATNTEKYASGDAVPATPAGVGFVFGDGSGNWQIVDSSHRLPVSATVSGTVSVSGNTYRTLPDDRYSLFVTAMQDDGSVVDFSALSVIASSTANVNTAIGAKTDSEASSDDGTFSLIALVKRLLKTRLPSLVSGRVPITFDGVTQTVSVSNFPAAQAVTGTFWQSTQPVSGPLTDTQLRANAVPVSGTFWQTTQPVSIASSVSVTGTFWQATQPVSIASAVPVTDNSGSLTVDGSAYRATVTITRPSNTTQYTAGDVIGIADGTTPANAGSAIHTLSSIGPSGGYVLLQSAALIFSDTSVISGMSTFRVHLYTDSPTAILDNAVFDLVSGDRAKYIGFFDLPTPVDFGSTLYTQADSIGRVIKLAASSTTLYAEIETKGTYTPASATTVELRLTTLEVSK